METIIIFLTNIWVIGVLFAGSLWLNHIQAKIFAMFVISFPLIAIIITYKIPSLYVLLGTLLFIPIGIVYSIHSWKRYVTKRVERYNKEIKGVAGNQDYYTIRMKEDIDPMNNIGYIVTEIFSWPLSLLDNFIGDSIDAVTNLVKTKLKTWYDSVSKNALSSAAIPGKKDDIK